MSLCRFSSNNFQCDVYVYEGDFGWTVKVARMHVVSEPPPSALNPEEPGITVSEAVARLKAQSDWLQKASFSAIQHPAAGKVFDFGAPRECAEFLKSLKGSPIRVPEEVIARLLDMETLPDSSQATEHP